NPDFKKVYEHGRAIADTLGLKHSAETFNPVIVDFYREVGYLPHAIVNAMLMLGWAYDGMQELFTRAEMVERFGLEKVNKAAASLDAAKLVGTFQDHWMRQAPLDEKVSACLGYLQRAGAVPAPAPAADTAKLTAIVQAAGDRIKVYGDVLDYVSFFAPD